MLKHSQRTTLSSHLACQMLAGLGATLLIAIPSAARAQSQACNVTLSIGNATFLRGLQLEVDYDAAVGGFASDVVCNVVPAGIDDTVNDQDARILEIGWVDTTGFTGPAPFATCSFIATGAPPLAAQFAVTVTDSTGAAAPPAQASPTPVIGVSVGSCAPVASDCGNGVLEDGEECEDGNVDGGDGCSASCLDSGSCAATPESGCKTAGGAKLSLKDYTKDPTDDSKDQGQYQWKKGAANDVSDFGNAVVAGVTYSWCVYENGELLLGQDVASGAGWSAVGTTGFQFKGDVDGVSQIKLKAGAEGKAQIQVKAKSKLGAYQSPALVVTEPVISQLVIDDGIAPVCFGASFSGATKNDAASYSATAP